jgi:hypothetical protein
MCGQAIKSRLKSSFKASLFAQSRRQAKILILEILNVFIRLKFLPSLTLNKLKRFEKGSLNNADLKLPTLITRNHYLNQELILRILRC